MSGTTAPSPHAAMNHRTPTGISSLSPEILQSHILTQLDGQTLASATCASTSFTAGNRRRLWSNICRSTWPSTAGDRLRTIVSTFSGDQNGPHSFFSHSYPLPSGDPTTISQNPDRLSPSSPSPASELISAVDVYHRSKPILTKTEETETISGRFRFSPFRIDMLDPKDVVPKPIPLPDGDDTCTALMDDMTVSWILIDPVSKLAVNLSSHKPVSVHQHWLSREVEVRFVSILAGESPAAAVIVVKCGGSAGGEMQMREVTMEVEDMDGKHLNGRDSLVILQRVMAGKRGSGVRREEEGSRRYRRFEEMKRERRERKLRVERTLDTLSLVFGLTAIFVGLVFVFF